MSIYALRGILKRSLFSSAERWAEDYIYQKSKREVIYLEKKNSFPFGDFTEKIAPKGKKNQSENDKTDSFSGGLFRKPLHKKAASFAEYEAMQKATPRTAR